MRAADRSTVLGSVWLRDEPEPTRAPLTRAEIVTTAIRLLDRDGLDRFSMRTMAAELGTAATSALYWRIATKDDLLELVVDEILALDNLLTLNQEPPAQLATEQLTPKGAAPGRRAARQVAKGVVVPGHEMTGQVPPAGAVPGRGAAAQGARGIAVPGQWDWRDKVSEVVHAAYWALSEHPWAAQLLPTHAGLGPNYQALTESVQQILTEARFKGTHLDAAMSAIFHYLIGSAVTDAAWRAVVRRSGLPESTWAQQSADRIGVDPTHLTAYLNPQSQAGPHSRFTTGLRAILTALRPRQLS
ncbi:TetR/AcrR family transcriptional regulator [Kribbella solani]|uniref:TetR/AcrR family transcriptional regulator n=1 Tax=Kribbella solani TaxID=236067 RepID=UPI0029A51D4C|nr:TetR/AcrR family transcriptional regulator [Kribbella solani]MDX2974036.1 TetR/AcrR family transcriptional regulator [Kribbella solani]